MLQSKYLRVSAVAAVSAAALFLLVEGIVGGDWIQILWSTLVVVGWIAWWRDESNPTSVRNGLGSRPWKLGRVCAGAALGVVGIVLLITQDALFIRISGGLLIASSACFGVALYYRWQSGERTLGPHID
ncbi:hypothetical protein A2J01_32190 [Rhodococcus sp. EPR-134]|jgi:hypothetical protein|nr:hypothetical protein ABM90_04280 [Rhodococcus erythropolis]KZF15181.1 hypothetical protein A2J01_32190 [Rhodococcus sp. EPR-134]